MTSCVAHVVDHVCTKFLGQLPKRCNCLTSVTDGKIQFDKRGSRPVRYRSVNQRAYVFYVGKHPERANTTARSVCRLSSIPKQLIPKPKGTKGHKGTWSSCVRLKFFMWIGKLTVSKSGVGCAQHSNEFNIATSTTMFEVASLSDGL
eukprot:229677-Prorocentrum_minimum.AAC.2